MDEGGENVTAATLMRVVGLRKSYGGLRAADDVSFDVKLRSSAETLDVQERQRIVRLLVKEVPVGDDTIIIRQSIPAPADPPSNDEPPSSTNGAGNPEIKSYLLRSERGFAFPK
ncbi:MAG: hypothetical protein HC871_06920 [Rhizobiales bacterium]|nr:hypothetical protein [Hyphomicrobiales bacterium]